MQPSPGDPGSRSEHAAAALAERARRLGPLPHSALGVLPSAEDLPAPGVVAAWESSLIDELWVAAGRPDPFTVVQAAAGEGAVPAEMLRSGSPPACSEALRLVLVEGDPTLRERHGLRLPVESPSLFLGPVAAAADPDEDPVPVTGIGPIVTSLAELPVVRGWCVVVAVGWLSRFAPDLFEWRSGRWYELRLAAADEFGPGLDEMSVEVDPDHAALLEALIAPDGRREGARYGVRDGASAWLRGACGAAESGWVVAADRWSETTSAAPDGAIPVAIDQLSPVRRPELYDPDGPGGLGVVRWRIG